MEAGVVARSDPFRRDERPHGGRAYIDATTHVAGPCSRENARPRRRAAASMPSGRMHTSGKTFKFRFELSTMIDNYLKILAGKRNTALRNGYEPRGRGGERTRSARCPSRVACRPANIASAICDKFHRHTGPTK